MNIRELVRTRVPFSLKVYEGIMHRRRKSASRRQIVALLGRGELKLDLGGGFRPGKNGWVNVDISPQCDFYWDLTDGLPFPDNSVSAIYSSHLLEHLTLHQSRKLLTECLRVLKPRSEISICVPNARIFIDHYLENIDLPQEFFTWEPAFNNTTRIDALNYVAYLDGEHRYMFDQENLLHVLKDAGFVNVHSRQFDPIIDDREREAESIFALGVKPLSNAQ